MANRYRIIGQLGEGGMSKVYLAEDVRLNGKRWAVKETKNRTEDLQLFLDEAEILIHLQHPYLPNIVDYFLSRESGCNYLVMDYIQGKSLLQHFIEQDKKPEYRQVIQYAIQICDLFHYMHCHKAGPIIYRDLKPTNIMIDELDHVRIIDFGIARNYKEGQHSDTMQLGTLGFAAPEQLHNNQSDQRTDLYTLGALMYFLLSKGAYYYTSRKPLNVIDDNLPAALVDIIHRLLQDHPQDRFQTALEVKIKLDGLLLEAGGADSARTKLEWKGSLRLIPKKLIVIGGMYRGAGSTFVTFALAKALSSYHIPNAVVEHPLHGPEHFSLLFGEARAPGNYRFASDCKEKDEGWEEMQQWKDGSTVWLPVNPQDGLPQSWDADFIFKLLHQIKTPVILFDISHHWNEPTLETIYQAADEIIMVADPLPTKITPRLTNEVGEFLQRLRKSGKSTRIIANRDHRFSHRAQWIRSLPMPPLCTVPDLPFRQITESIWKGSMIQHDSAVLEVLREALFPLICTIVPLAHLAKANGNKRGKLASLLKGKQTSVKDSLNK